jgi:hypothetical protein
LALLHPACGCNRLDALEWLRLSAITIQKILNDKGLGTRHERWRALEALQADLDAWLHHFNHERPRWATATRAAARGRL